MHLSSDGGRWILTAAVVVALAIGFAAGRAGPWGAGAAGRAATQPTDPTATREAEVRELERLRTQVAATPPVCTPPPEPTTTPTPAPTTTPTPVPPAAIGSPLPYGDDWTVVVTNASSRPTVGTETATGFFVQVNVTVTNHAATPRPFPFGELVVDDPQGRVFELATAASSQIALSWYRAVKPSLPTDLAVVFEVTADAGERFVLESTEDPTFRVQLELAQRG
jgi:hypothetical protein